MGVACALTAFSAAMPGQEAKLSEPPYASIGAVAYRGPARSPEFDLHGDVIRIGILAPLHGPEKADGDAIVLAARLALRDASRQPFPGGLRLELAIEDEAGPAWGQTADALLKLVNQDHALAVITSPDGATAHLSEQVGNRIGVPILTLSTDPTTTEIDLPWIFRLGPSDSQLMESIVNHAQGTGGSRRIVLVAENDHDGRIGAQELDRAVKDAAGLSATCVLLDPQYPDFHRVQAELEKEPAAALVVRARSEVAAQWVKRLRDSAISTPVYLSPEAAQAGFVSDSVSQGETANSPFGEVFASVWYSREALSQKHDPASIEMPSGVLSGPVASEAYDAVSLLADAFRKAGPNRARVRDWIAGVKDRSGVSGRISFDDQGNNSPGIRWVRLSANKRSPQTD
jgi:branched-chain amino acid transport system substrate-binding protein